MVRLALRPTGPALALLQVFVTATESLKSAPDLFRLAVWSTANAYKYVNVVEHDKATVTFWVELVEGLESDPKCDWLLTCRQILQRNAQ